MRRGVTTSDGETMTGRQHAAIGIGLTLPLGAQAALNPLASAWLPAWAGAAGWLAGPVLAGLVISGGLLGALLPDLDTDRSLLESAPRQALRRLGRQPWLWPLAPILLLLTIALWLLNEFLMVIGGGHRSATHSLTALLVVVALGWFLTAWAVGATLTAGLALGYVSHLVADALTPRGVQLLAPWSRRHWRLLPRLVSFGAESRRAGCLTTLVLLGGLGLALWLVWLALRPGG